MSIKYLVNEEQRTITAYFAEGEKAWRGSLYSYLNKRDPNDDFWKHHQMAVDSTINSFRGTMVGIAKCHPDDKWDEHLGKELARKRLLSRIDRAVESVGQNLDNIISQKLNTFRNRIYRVNRRV